MTLVSLYGNHKIWHANTKSNQEEIEKIVKKDNTAKALEYLWNSVKPTLNNLLTYNGPITQTPEQYIKEAKWIAKLINVDIDKIYEDVSKQKGFTEPKSWKNLKADGTPKTRKKSQKKKVA
jgi:hypothetical protein